MSFYPLKKLVLCFSVSLFLSISFKVSAQQLLEKRISMTVDQQKLGDVLEQISSKGSFYFSYSSRYLPADSLVTFSAKAAPVREVLDELLGENFEYKESASYIILRPAPYRLSLVPEEIPGREKKKVIISGYVVDDNTGEGLKNASVYDKRLLVGTLTDKKGYFKLKIPESASQASLTVSKEFYRDTSLNILLFPAVVRSDGKEVNSGYGPVGDSDKVERTAFGRMLLSSRQKIQSLNLGSFFANSPVQASFTPGLSTQGLMSSQIISNISLNILGGYTTGVSGLEVAGLFNIDKKNVQYVQTAGIFNIVGGNLTGVQTAGISNTILDSLYGLQAAGIYNFVKGHAEGFQAAGIANHAPAGFKGFQVAGILNYSGSFKGMQVAGITNISRKKVKGVQIAGILNYTDTLKGVQIGLVNIVTGSSDGVSIGLFNYSKNGYHKISAYSSEILNTNLSFKTGNSKFYSIFTAGANVSPSAKAYGFGAGFGHDFLFKNRWSVSAQLISQNIYLGYWDDLASVSTLTAPVNVKLNKTLSLFAGPSFNVTWGVPEPAEGYRSLIPKSPFPIVDFSDYVKGWLGFQAGITLW